MDKQEKAILDKLSDNRRESHILGKQLAEYRLNRARNIRDMYFKEKKKQTEIAKTYGIGQGSVSRIIAEMTCVDVEDQLKG